MKRQRNIIPLTDSFKELVEKCLNPEFSIRNNLIEFEKMAHKYRAVFYIRKKSGGCGMEATISANSISDLEKKVIVFIS